MSIRVKWSEKTHEEKELVLSQLRDEYRGSKTLAEHKQADYIPWECQCGHKWEAQLTKRQHSGRGCPACGRKKLARGLAIRAAAANPIKDPLLIKQYRGERPIEEVAAGSDYRPLWECEYGHTWKGIVQQRSKGSGCPKCAIKKSKGHRPAASIVNPLPQKLLQEYRGIIPKEELTASLAYLTHWECSRCHCRWKATVVHRSRKPACPACTDKNEEEVVDFLKIYSCPKFISENQTPSRLGEYVTTQALLWKCQECSTKWTASLIRRVYSKTGGCPECKKKLNNKKREEAQWAAIDTTLIEKEYKEDLPLKSFSIRSGVIVTWQCSKCPHVWKATINHRVAKGKGCPECIKREGLEKRARNKAIKNGLTDEILLKEYRGSYPVDSLSKHSSKNVFWQCSKCPHMWEATINNRSNGTGCPECGRKSCGIQSSTEAAASNPITDPVMLKEYRGVRPIGELSANSGYKTTWQCSKCPHKWDATVDQRSKGGCRKCSIREKGRKRRIAAAKKNPLTNLALINEYRGPRPLNEISKYSNYRAQWQCSKCLNEWSTSVGNRSKGKGCSVCGSPGGYSLNKPGAFYFIVSHDGTIGKVGISNFLQDRLATHRKIKFSTVVFTHHFSNGKEAVDVEKIVLSFIRHTLGVGKIKEHYSGRTEMFYLQEITAASKCKDPTKYLSKVIKQEIAALLSKTTP